jgi:serpin B
MMNRKMIAALLLGLAACGQPPKGDKPKTDKPKVEPTTTPTKVEEPATKTSGTPATTPATGPGLAENPDAKELAKGNNTFAFALYDKLKSTEGSFFLSPYSVSTALAMTYGGARGDTAAEMKKTLGFTLPDDKLHAAFGTLQAAYNATGKRYELRVANRLWGAKGLAFADDYVKLTKETYSAPLEAVDFAKSEEARKTINTWVEEQTNNKIKDLIPPGIINGGTKLVLTNAIYFKGNWASQFKKELTRDEPFQLSAAKKAMVPMMHQHGEFKQAAADGVQLLELPYVGDELAMVILLPEKVDGLAELEKKLTADNLDKWLASLGSWEGDVGLPKFTLDAKFKMAKVLKEMGMAKAFSGADFSGMTKETELQIDEVVHQAFVDVNEEGTEAAAATAVVMGEAAAMPRSFLADHPFVFLIRDVKTGGVLFLGRYTGPAK